MFYSHNSSNRVGYDRAYDVGIERGRQKSTPALKLFTPAPSNQMSAMKRVYLNTAVHGEHGVNMVKK